MKNLSLLAVYAHPDDEAYGSAGTLAKYSHEGVRTYLLSATRGEAGEISDPALATAGNLGAVREAELRRSCEILGVDQLRLLDCKDGAVDACPESETIAKIVAAIRQWRPQVVITFGPEGVYGHTDHVAVHHLTVAACDFAGNPQVCPDQLATGLAPFSPSKLYYRVLPKHLSAHLGAVFQEIRRNLGLPEIDIDTLFATEDEVTTAIDVAKYAELKRQAIAAHRTQIAGEPYAGESPEEIRAELGCEYYRLRGARRAPGQPLETDLFAGVR